MNAVAVAVASSSASSSSSSSASSSGSAPAPSSLPSAALARRLADLCGDERNIQVDFLLHLAEFDRRGGHAEAGYGSLWAYCLEVLHLCESSAGRRIAAMKHLRRFPSLEAPLRDGRLSLSTVNLLGPLLTEASLDELVGRAAFLSKADTERLVVSIQPRVAPRDGIRRLPSAGHASLAAATLSASPAVGDTFFRCLPEAAAPSAEATGALLGEAVVERPPSRNRAELRPISADLYSLRATLDAATKAELDQLISLTSHTTRGDLAAVLCEAIRCGIAKHGKRKGAVAPERTVAVQRSQAREAAAVPADPARPEKRRDPRAIPAAVRREVWKRDGGCCAWTSPDGKRCGSTFMLELDHVHPVALGGQSTADNLRIACRLHNRHEAVRIFGRAHMAPFLGEITPAGGSHDP